ncbi:Cyclic nucleotide-binding domain-containing protein 2 [Acropora cervicornis]|uniref:Cyclic nucleotide-binding domain-containing protein 2 n=1 Tax=Acropora cervicornis TaxID=6130 RepID=A0AAD9QKT5_ACRCE|nr:Cyclic nucleotide-binding domain-containing protein 2 [Acropora cervicornis]
MLPSFDKKSGWFPKRDSQNRWDFNKTPSSTSEFERDRDRNKLPSRSRNQTRSVTHQNSLPTIIEPTEAARTCTTSVNEEFNGSKTEKTDRVSVCMKRWKKVGLGRSHASSSSVHDHFEPLENFKRLARLVMVVIRIGRALSSDPKAIFPQEGICKSFLEIMEGYTTTKEQHHRRNDGQTAGHSSPAPLFDPKMFKANREVNISKEVKQLLTSYPVERSNDQLQTVLYALQTLESFSELPLHMQQDVCKIAWLQSLPSNRIIIKQDHAADNFYFIINGAVTVLSESDPTLEQPFTSLATLKKGSSFGDTAILKNCRRTATVVSRDPVQLLVIGKEDYQRIFMGQTKSGEEPAHLKFCRRGSVIVKDSNKSDWLYVIVSGVCQVLLRLEITKPRFTGKLQTSAQVSTAEKLADLTENRHRKTAYSASGRRSRKTNTAEDHCKENVNSVVTPRGTIGISSHPSLPFMRVYPHYLILKKIFNFSSQQVSALFDHILPVRRYKEISRIR